MTDYERETDRVLMFDYRRHGSGGELPVISVRVLPADRAGRIIDLDERIQKIKSFIPYSCCAAACIGIILAAYTGLMAPGLSALGVAACILQTIRKGGHK